MERQLSSIDREDFDDIDWNDDQDLLEIVTTIGKR